MEPVNEEYEKLKLQSESLAKQGINIGVATIAGVVGLAFLPVIGTALATLGAVAGAGITAAKLKAKIDVEAKMQGTKDSST